GRLGEVVDGLLAFEPETHDLVRHPLAVDADAGVEGVEPGGLLALGHEPDLELEARPAAPRDAEAVHLLDTVLLEPPLPVGQQRAVGESAVAVELALDAEAEEEYLDLLQERLAGRVEADVLALVAGIDDGAVGGEEAAGEGGGGGAVEAEGAVGEALGGAALVEDDVAGERLARGGQAGGHG